MSDNIYEKKPNDGPSVTIFPEDIEESKKFLREVYEYEVKKPNSKATQAVAELYIEHSERVGEIAKIIALTEKLDAPKLELAGILHDCGKLHSLMPGGIDEISHGARGQRKSYDFMVERLGKNPHLAHEVAFMVARHIYTPENLKAHPNYSGIEAPESVEEWALRDANMLDYIDFWGMRHVVLIIHEAKAPLSMYGGSDRTNSLRHAVKRRVEFISAIRGKTAKKVAVAMKARSDRFITFIKDKSIKNIEVFNGFFDEFLTSELKK